MYQDLNTNASIVYPYIDTKALTDALLAEADFGDYECIDDSGAESSTSSKSILITYPIYFKVVGEEGEDLDSECVSMDITIDLETQKVSVEHLYAKNADKLEELANKLAFPNKQ